MQEGNQSICVQPSVKSPRRDLPDSTSYKESQHQCSGHPYAGESNEIESLNIYIYMYIMRFYEILLL